LGAGSGLTQAALLLLAVTSGAPTEAANDALLINEIADGRDILFWTQDDPAVFVSVSPLRSEWRVARPSVLYVMCKPDNACEVLVLRTLLGSGGTQRCARQPRSWRRDAARPRKRSNTIETRLWPAVLAQQRWSCRSRCGTGRARAVSREAGFGRQLVVPSLRQAESSARNYM